jgi:PERQ amino acid-rich with GYF domain-containing protein
MQKWYDEGYFTPDLLMKRTHIDRDWTAVGILDRQAVGGQIFLSQFPISTGPPGLSIRTESSSLQNHSPAHSTFSGYQPAPTRTLRTMTLNPYLNSASPSDSPSSSFGGGRFGNGSPESSALGSRVGDLYTGDSGLGPRAFAGNPGPFVDPVGDPRSSFGNVAPGRASSLDTFSAYNNNSNSPWPLSVTQNVQNFGSSEHPLTTGFNVMSAPVPITQSHSFTQEPAYVDSTYNAMGSLGTSHDSPITRHPIEANGRGFNNLINGASGSPYTPHYPQSPVVPQQRSSTSPFGEVLATVSESPDVRILASAVQSENLSSPWRAPESTSARRPVIDPIPSPIAQAPPAVRSQPAQPIRPTPKLTEPSPWLKASLGVVDDGWRELPGPNSLTVSNLGQHNKMYEEADDDGTVAVSPIGEEEEEIIPAAAPEPETANPVPSAPATVTAAPIIDPPVSTAPKTKVKPTVREPQALAPVSAPKPAPPVPASSAPAVTSSSPVPKAAWATEDDVKKGKSSLSLREIQEAEAKKAEARKVTERERLARANTLPPPAVIDDAQPYTTSWGLPTSQTGARAVIPPRGGEVVGTPAASAPVWTTGSTAPAKKTMKEIQEEEERRKKMAVKETVAAAAARRGYAETTFKVCAHQRGVNYFLIPFFNSLQATPSAQASGGAWSTVGANGKTSAPVSAPIRPAVVSSVSTQATATSRPNGTTVRPVVQTATKAVSPPRVDEAPVVPAQDFLKWLNDALKGLNHSVNRAFILLG